MHAPDLTRHRIRKLPAPVGSSAARRTVPINLFCTMSPEGAWEPMASWTSLWAFVRNQPHMRT